MKHHLKLLGFKVSDAVTGFSGVVTSITFDLYGCVQALVTPPREEKSESQWFDTKRLAVKSKTPVMIVPTFDAVPGGQALPLASGKPLP